MAIRPNGPAGANALNDPDARNAPNALNDVNDVNGSNATHDGKAPDAIGPVEQRIFREGQLTIGLTLPLLPPGTAEVDLHAQLALAERADALGFDALWIRDVPLNSPDYPDPVGHSDPWVLIGALAVRTHRIALITGAIVLTLRHPLHVAKAAASASALSGGRLVLGLGSGDRPAEYAAFGRQTEARRTLFRSHWETVAAALGPDARVIPDLVPPRPQADDGTENAPAGRGEAARFSLLPRPVAPVPMLAVGSAGQSVDWIARHAIGWATYHREPEVQRERYQLWRRAVERVTPDAFRSFTVAMRVELADNPRHAPEPLGLGYRVGSRALVDVLAQLRDRGTHHVALNLTGYGRPQAHMLEELAASVLPAFRPSPDAASSIPAA
ncbi:luciferase-type oxidoreductase [Cupriavidus gilardii J11]|uniref:Luciferase-type oxidoreductase n=1 Tax=Cupriavidus gilardii J11 TaxID=936133 RepID=A0A562BPY8_9BURK|nr:luciferase-type oxidoreductase [Cupriavidus gilardii J11]